MRTSRVVQQAEGLLADKWADFVSWFARSALDVQSHSVSSLKTAFNQSGECGGSPVSMDGRLPGAAVTTVPTLVSRVPPVPHSFHCSPLFSLFRCSRAPGRLTAERVACSSRSGLCLVVLSWSDKEAAPNPSNYHSPNGIISAWTAAVAKSVPCPTPTPNLPHGCNVY